jgi:hypothetical protein
MDRRPYLLRREGISSDLWDPLGLLSLQASVAALHVRDRGRDRWRSLDRARSTPEAADLGWADLLWGSSCFRTVSEGLDSYSHSRLHNRIRLDIGHIAGAACCIAVVRQVQEGIAAGEAVVEGLAQEDRHARRVLHHIHRCTPFRTTRPGRCWTLKRAIMPS